MVRIARQDVQEMEKSPERFRETDSVYLALRAAGMELCD